MASRYFVGNGTDWNSVSSWATTSGGSSGASVPVSTDDVFLDANSPGNGTISVSLTIQSLDCTGYSHTLIQNVGRIITIAGNGVICKFVAGMTYTLGSTVNTGISFTGTSGTIALTTAGKIMGPLNINVPGATFQLQDNIISSQASFTFTAGILDTQNFNVAMAAWSSTGTNLRTLSLGSSVITVGTWDMGTGTNMTLNAGTSTINVGTAGSHNFNGGSKTYNIVTFSQDLASNTVIGGSNTFSQLSIVKTSAGLSTNSTTFTVGTTQTATTFILLGVNGHLAVINSSSSGFHGTISVASGTVNADYASIKDSTATGGATFNAGANSTDAGGNVGWIFGAPSITYNKFQMMV